MLLGRVVENTAGSCYFRNWRCNQPCNTTTVEHGLCGHGIGCWFILDRTGFSPGGGGAGGGGGCCCWHFRISSRFMLCVNKLLHFFVNATKFSYLSIELITQCIHLLQHWIVLLILQRFICGLQLHLLVHQFGFESLDARFQRNDLAPQFLRDLAAGTSSRSDIARGSTLPASRS